jgi:hypothetical protein
MAKGGNFENEVCKQLSLAYSKGTRDDLFARTDGSGGKATRRRKKGLETANATGDIGIADVIGKPLIDSWGIECKAGYSKKIKSKYGIEFTRCFKKHTKTEQKWFSSIGERDKWLHQIGPKISDVKELSGIKERDIPWDILDLIDSQQKKTQLEDFWDQCTRDAKLTNRIPVLIFRRNNRSPCIAFSTNDFDEWVNCLCLIPDNNKLDYIYISKLNIFVFNFKEFLSVFDFSFLSKERTNEEKTKEVETSCPAKTSRKKQLRRV